MLINILFQEIGAVRKTVQNILPLIRERTVKVETRAGSAVETSKVLNGEYK